MLKRFNSKMVRLIAALLRTFIIDYDSFNSKMVRLIVTGFLTTIANTLFQFQNGSINSNSADIDGSETTLFQFQNGSINS